MDTRSDNWFTRCQEKDYLGYKVSVENHHITYVTEFKYLKGGKICHFFQ
jgi:hypothetical protein